MLIKRYHVSDMMLCKGYVPLWLGSRLLSGRPQVRALPESPTQSPSVRHMHPESLSRAFARACDRLGIADASTHDLRRTCLSGLIELGHESVAERIASHAPRHVLGRHYDRSSRMEAMRAGLEAWSQAVDSARDRAMARATFANADRLEALGS